MGFADKIRLLGRNYVTALLLRKAWCGDFGRFPQWVVIHLSEIGTDVGIVFGVAAGFIATLEHTGACALAASYWTWVRCDVWATRVAETSIAVSGVFLYLSQTLGGLHLQAPTPGDGTK